MPQLAFAASPGRARSRPVERRPTVMLAIPSLAMGGAERVFTTLLAHLDADAFDLKLALGSAAPTPLLAGLPPHVEVIELGGGRARGLALGLTWWLRRHPVDLVLSTLDHLNIALCALRPLWPKQVRLAVRATSVENLARWPYVFGMRRFYPNADAIIFQSAAMHARYAALAIDAPCERVIANPIDLARVRGMAARGCPARRWTGAPHLVTVGRLDPVKGFDLLLRALASTRAAPTLDIIGEGPARRELERLVRALGLAERVRFRGFATNPYPMVSAADGFVLSSRSEGFPNTVLEALALGAPVIATPVAGLERTFARTPGVLITDAIDAASLAAALDRFCEARPPRPGPDIVAGFDAASIARRYETLFAELTTHLHEAAP